MVYGRINDMSKLTKVVETFVAVPPSNDRRFIDIAGQVFTRLTVISYAGHHEWNCICACGIKVIIKGGHLRSGNTKSCGCLHRDWLAENNTRHGDASRRATTPEYRAYHQAKDRCYNTHYHAYKSYGGRGIQFKFDSFAQFLEHIGRRPSNRHTLDRIDVDGHYEIGNVRWVTMHEQNRNRSDHRFITINGATQCVADCADAYGVSPDLVYERLSRGWCAHCSLTRPLRPGVRSCRHKTT